MNKPNLSRVAQRERLIAWLREHGQIATTEAREILNIMHVSGRVMELRREGHPIITTWRYIADSAGVRHRQGVYCLLGGARHE